MRTDAPFPVQMGSLNSGRFPAYAGFDELRISRTARYTEDFSPPTRELELDPDTAALFHLNGGLAGEGIAPDGSHHSPSATAGPVAYR